MPGLEHRLFSTSQAAKTGIITIIDSHPCLKRNQHVQPLQQLNMNQELLSFDLEIAEATSDEVALSAIRVPADIWHRRVGHINSQSLRILRDNGDNGDNGIIYSDNRSPVTCARLGKESNCTIPRQLRTLPIGLSNWFTPIFSGIYPHLNSENFVTSAYSRISTANGRRYFSSKSRVMQ